MALEMVNKLVMKGDRRDSSEYRVPSCARHFSNINLTSSGHYRSFKTDMIDRMDVKDYFSQSNKAV